MSRPTADSIREWMRANRRGYKQASKRFGITEEEARAICSAPPGPRLVTSADVPAPTSVDESGIPEPPVRPDLTGNALARWRARLPPLEHALDKLVQVEEALDQAIMSGTNSAGTRALMSEATAQVVRRDELLAQRPDLLASMTPEALSAWLDTTLADWPDQHLEAALLVYAQRHKGAIRLATEDHQRELTADGWGPVPE
jgi:hypothetical protein